MNGDSPISMAAKTEQLPILVGLAMALAAVVAALGLLLTYPLALFPELLVNCGRAGLGEAACSSGAHKVGLVSVGAGALALIVTIAAACWKAPWAKRAEQYHPTVVRFLLAVSAAVVSAHLGAQYFGPADLTPFRLLQRYSGYISIENLLWPVLVQVLVLQRDMSSRLQVLAILLPITAVTPHRAVVVAIFIFGFALLLVADFWQVLESRTTTRAVHRFTAQLAIVVVAAGCFTSSFYFQSRNRSLDWSPVKAPVFVGAAPPVMPGIFGDRSWAGSGQEVKPLAPGVWTDVARRTIHPLVQGAMVENIALSRSLPTILDEMKRKLRLATAPTLNEFIYALCYGDSGVGQATVLYYGEAIAYWPLPPITWMILAPLVLVGICFGLRKRGIVVSTIVGIGLWRGSLAGMVTLLPAMVLQTL